jgi:hypothetical protein
VKVVQGVSVIYALGTAALWVGNAMRSEPRKLLRFEQVARFPIPIPARMAEQDRPSWIFSFNIFFLPAGAILLAVGGLAYPADGDVAGRTAGQLVFLAAVAVAGWVWTVTPDMWWCKPSADDALDEQVQQDWITATLGTLVVVFLWGFPWFLGVLGGAAFSSTINRVVIVACIGAAAGGWLLSNTLMRRWLLGPSTASSNRPWLDAAFAVVVALLVTVLMRSIETVLKPFILPGSSLLGEFARGVVLFIALALSVVAWHFSVRANLGIRPDSRAWRPLVTAMFLSYLAGAAFVAAGLIVLLSPNLESFEKQLNLSDAFFRGVIFAIFNVPPLIVYTWAIRSTWRVVPDSVFASLRLGRRLVVIWLAYLTAIAAFVGLLSIDGLMLLNTLLNSFRVFDLDSGGVFSGTFLVFILPFSLAFWPVFRFIGPGAAHAALLRRQAPDAPTVREPWWLLAMRSPWWGTVAMWLCAIGWSTSLGAVSFAPLAVPLAVAMAWKHGGRAMVPIFVGTFPLLLRVEGAPFTPGGVWSAVAVLLCAKLAADAAFRQRLLRRERLSWAEALLIVAVLSPGVDLPLELSGTRAFVNLEPGWMLTSIAFIVGASRMPAHKFAIAIASSCVISFWKPLSFGIGMSDALAAMFALYAAWAWRTYVAGLQAYGANPFTEFADRRLGPTRRTGMRVLVFSILIFGTFIVGAAPGFRTPGISPVVFAPGVTAVLVAAFVLGVIAPDPLVDPGILFRPRSGSGSFNPMQTFRAPIFLFGLIAIGMLWARDQYRISDTLTIGMFERYGLFETLGRIGVAICALGFAAFGFWLRVVIDEGRPEVKAFLAAFWRGVRQPRAIDTAPAPTSEVQSRRMESTIEATGEMKVADVVATVDDSTEMFKSTSRRRPKKKSK